MPQSDHLLRRLFLPLALPPAAMDCPSLPEPQLIKLKRHRPTRCLRMAGSSKDSDVDSQLFPKVFTEGPLQELASRCDVITSVSLVGSSKLII